MKLAQPFYRLPHTFDAATLAQEIAQFSASDWQRHPQGYAGNSAIRLISVGGLENDDFVGPMNATPALDRCPYIKQVLASFGVVWSRSRLMRLEAGALVPEHSDINYHWMTRVRLHIPILTQPDVRFTCGGTAVHMAAGEAWTFDNWRLHSVENNSPAARVHLVADTVGNARFWGWLNQVSDYRRPPRREMHLPFSPGASPSIQMEQHNTANVMPPAEIELLVGDLLSDLQAPATNTEATVHHQFTGLAITLVREWRSLWGLYGDGLAGWVHYSRLRDQLKKEVLALPGSVLSLASNGASAVEVFVSRVLLYAFHPPQAAPVDDHDRTLRAQTVADARPRGVTPPADQKRLDRPVFIIAAPRSGSSLLFETLANIPGLYTLGGEGHGWIENIRELQPFASGTASNRLDASHANADVRQQLLSDLTGKLRDRDGNKPAEMPLRFLEKTPKNALRVPFFDALFPDARFVYLWRDPRENIGSIIDAWQSGGWITYPDLEGWDGPWSLLLPPGWQQQRGKSLAEIAAFQWAQTNAMALDDLSKLEASRWVSIGYAELLENPSSVVHRIARFAELGIDDRVDLALNNPLPLSAYTLTPPRPDKWKRHQSEIENVMPSVAAVVDRISQL